MTFYSEFKLYCNQENMPTLAEINDCYNICKQVDDLAILEQIKVILEDTISTMKATRAMLILECYLRSKKVEPGIFDSIFFDSLTNFQKNCNSKDAVIKAKKILLIISTLNRNKGSKT